MTQDAGWGGGGAYGGAPHGGIPYGGPPGQPGWGGWGGWPPPPQPGVIPLAPLQLSDLLSGALSTMGRYWKQLFGMAAALYGGALLVMAAAVAIAYASVSGQLDRVVSLSDGGEPASRDVVALVTALCLIGVLGILVMAIVSGLMYAAVPAVLQEAVLGRPLAFATVWSRAWGRAAAVIGTVVLTALVPVVLAMVAVTGIVIGAATMDSGAGSVAVMSLGVLGALATAPLAAWLWTKFCLAPAAVVFEGHGPVGALSRSSQLVRGDWWRIFGITLLAHVMAAMAGYFIQMPFSILGMFPGLVGASSLENDPSVTAVLTAMSGYLVAMVLGQLLSQIVSTTFPPLVTGLLYVDRRMRTENLGPVLAEAAGVPQQGGAADPAPHHP